MAKISTDIKLAAEYLKKGEVIAIPSETVYGLAGNAFDPTAVSKIFEVKKRPFFNPLIVHTNSIDKIFEFADLAGPALKLAEKFWPGPLTLLLPKKDNVPDLVTAGSPVIAVRIPGHPLTLQLLEIIDFPLAAPSANPFGYVSPTTAEHVVSQLGEAIPFVLDGGPCSVGIESTIVGFDFSEDLLIYRVGGLSIEDIETETGKKAILLNELEKLPTTPGRLKSHYATSTAMLTGKINEMISNYDPKKTGIISFKTTYPGVPISQQMILSPEGNLQEAAQKLFSAMRMLDKLNLDIILAEEFPEIGLGRAINDRLKKAGHNSI
ncbi:MAG: threonylcarbamoyl-AMP synthase [Bacteroidetes bacterium]|nr:threonylcarbamoyl-AMP synthase [Bacteroidota bacterium]HET6243376.1 L-threonylcarbamoyladenylate synthase [Bacteroidia bacterium]